MEVPRCQTCKATDNLRLNSIYTAKNGNKKYSYLCRGCNTKRVKKYRATANGTLKTRKAVYRSVTRHKYKQSARAAIGRHVREGLVPKPKSCDECSSSHKLEAHHYDYEKPYDVVWLCKSCHADTHNKQRTSRSANHLRMIEHMV